MTRTGGVVAGLLVLIVGTAARADTVSATLTGTNPNSYTVKVDGQTVSGYAGAYTWTNNSMPDGLPATFKTYCVELLQDIGFNTPYTYTTVPVSQVPQPGQGVPGDSGSGMGNQRATYISELWGTFNSATTTNDAQAAFQIAIWEFVYGSSSDGWNVTDSSANFYVESGTDYSTVVALAQQWVNYVVAGQNLTTATDLIGLTSPTAQDQITTVPAPPSLLLAGVGGLGLIFGTRRRRILS